jgi:hypothetical protein
MRITRQLKLRCIYDLFNLRKCTMKKLKSKDDLTGITRSAKDGPVTCSTWTPAGFRTTIVPQIVGKVDTSTHFLRIATASK